MEGCVTLVALLRGVAMKLCVAMLPLTLAGVVAALLLLFEDDDDIIKDDDVMVGLDLVGVTGC